VSKKKEVWFGRIKELGEVCFTLAQGIKMKRVFQGTTWVEKRGAFFSHPLPS